MANEKVKIKSDRPAARAFNGRTGTFVRQIAKGERLFVNGQDQVLVEIDGNLVQFLAGEVEEIDADQERRDNRDAAKKAQEGRDKKAAEDGKPDAAERDRQARQAQSGDGRQRGLDQTKDDPAIANEQAGNLRPGMPIAEPPPGSGVIAPNPNRAAPPGAPPPDGAQGSPNPPSGQPAQR